MGKGRVLGMLHRARTGHFYAVHYARHRAMHCTLHGELPYAMHYALCTVHYAQHAWSR